MNRFSLTNYSFSTTTENNRGNGKEESLYFIKKKGNTVIMLRQR